MIDKNYLGITGITSFYEIQNIKEIQKKYQIEDLMFGILISYKMLSYHKRFDKKEYPPLHKISALLRRIQNNLENIHSTIHYNTKTKNFFSEIQFLLTDLNLLQYIDGMQFNITEPNPNSLKKVNEEYPSISLIFQINKIMSEKYNKEEISNILKNSYSFCDFFIIDSSMGEGKNMDMKYSISLYRKIKDKMPNKRVIFAGGFSPINIEERIKILKRKIGSSDFGIDVQTGLRTEDYSSISREKVESFLSIYKSLM